MYLLIYIVNSLNSKISCFLEHPHPNTYPYNPNYLLLEETTFVSAFI